MAVLLDDGTEITIREIERTDKAALALGLERLSDETVQRRFLSPKPSFSRAELRYLTEVDGVDHVALVAAPAENPARLLGVARFVRLAGAPDTAEFAVVVDDELQGRGIGRQLGLALADAARERGIEHFTASILGENPAARRLADSIALRMARRHTESGVTELTADLAA